MLRAFRAVGLLPVAVLLAGCGGGSSGTSPAQFSARTAAVCGSVAPRLKLTSSAITGLDKLAGKPLGKLPRLASLLDDLANEFSDLHAGLARVTAPGSQKAAYGVFLGDLDRLQGLTRTGVAALKPGTLGGLRQFQALGGQLNSTDTALAADAAKVPGLSACNNLPG